MTNCVRATRPRGQVSAVALGQIALRDNAAQELGGHWERALSAGEVMDGDRSRECAHSGGEVADRRGRAAEAHAGGEGSSDAGPAQATYSGGEIPVDVAATDVASLTACEVGLSRGVSLARARGENAADVGPEGVISRCWLQQGFHLSVSA